MLKISDWLIDVDVTLWLCREHDKNPESFFTVLYALHDQQVNFKLSVLGQTFTDVPGVYTSRFCCIL